MPGLVVSRPAAPACLREVHRVVRRAHGRIGGQAHQPGRLRRRPHQRAIGIAALAVTDLLASFVQYSPSAIVPSLADKVQNRKLDAVGRSHRGVVAFESCELVLDAFNGVSKAYAIQAGRELRIIVESDQVSDNEAIWLSKDIAKRIEKEVQYPGEIKVTVIRETRAVGLAR